MTEHSHLSSNLRRQPKQQRGKERVEKILDAAAAVFDEMGYEAATTHLIAAKAGTAIGSLYQFFPDKAAIFHAMELRHIERVQVLWAQLNTPEIIALPLRQMVHRLVTAVTEMFEHPVSRVVFVQFYMKREVFQSIDDSMTQEAIDFTSSLLQPRNPNLSEVQCHLLAEVCVHSSNALILSALRNPDQQHRQQLVQQIEDLLVSYLEPYVGDSRLSPVMKVMKCPHCQSQQLSKNGYRRGKQCYLCKDCGKQFVEN
ncbi:MULTISPECIES: TetR/AcrR family transcriptional regulator [unclassified Tolypothrix]|uniref:TetR/AcrR family transcriptional regulator n=1 Tax=unclassified Tolypothrix TaxID=2649714 RepID=UPI0005EABB74|nr:putative TetR family protein [Tolypothrix sp. PCC 7601]MBE9083450.1 TetR family transcriptional regulator [Tolypothrix sp. LEGE 11397]UYD24043.1 TetR family transcriptional regulator [Tolypothrix sp. PCC 7712]UYD33727.1 TetR family transcriptional regulator [Tolypothrix sp. PCC 7601]BAY89787.1 TetR family transcriptional regulator protein [Microchaete diplosiphon NIES-3275]